LARPRPRKPEEAYNAREKPKKNPKPQRPEKTYPYSLFYLQSLLLSAIFSVDDGGWAVRSPGRGRKGEGNMEQEEFQAIVAASVAAETAARAAWAAHAAAEAAAEAASVAAETAARAVRIARNNG